MSRQMSMIDEKPTPLPVSDAQLLLFPRLGLGEDDQVLLGQLIDHTPWRQDDITLFGKTHRQPRLVAWYGDPGASYTYSGIRHEPLPWTPTLQQLRQRVQAAAGHKFNSVLLNYYRDERDSMGLHADDEPELGPRPVIASLSLGETRRIYFKHKTRRDVETVSYNLPSTSLLIMKGETQRYWRHGIRKLTRACGPRVNLTFRLVGVAGAN